MELQTSAGSRQALVDSQVDGQAAGTPGEAGKEMSVTAKLSDAARRFWLSKRQALLIELGALEDMLGLKRSVEPKHKKRPIIKPKVK